MFISRLLLTGHLFMLYWSSSYCIMTIMIIVYKMVVLHMTYCTCTVLLFSVCTLIVYNIICGQFICLRGRPVSEL